MYADIIHHGRSKICSLPVNYSRVNTAVLSRKYSLEFPYFWGFLPCSASSDRYSLHPLLRALQRGREVSRKSECDLRLTASAMVAPIPRFCCDFWTRLLRKFDCL
jgi:hypothetical protein